MTSECWELHVLRRHAELVDHLDSIESAIANPDFIHEDATFADRQSFYSFGIVPGYDRYYLKVSIEFRGIGESPESSGEVVTAYISRNRKPGERLLWRKTT